MNQLVATYSSALYDLSKDEGKTNRLVEELDGLAPIFQEKEIQQFFASPVTSAQDKEAVLLKALGDKLDKSIVDFLKILAKNNRLALVPEIINAFKETCAMNGKGVRRGEVSSATELSSSEKTSIQQSIEKKLGFPVSLDYKINTELVGGIEAKVGSYVISDSIKSGLTRMTESLKRRTN
ncbi:MAG: ATP synthase F1 subunit delta [Bdellovibrionales bacterium]|nr:ATP synthase F1 subunit delta [Bdellovibrionales bacterium]